MAPSLNPIVSIGAVVGCILAYFFGAGIISFVPTWIHQLLFFFLPGVIGIYVFLPKIKFLSPVPLKTYGLVLLFTLFVSIILTLLAMAWFHFFPIPNFYHSLLPRVPKPHLLLQNPQLLLAVCLVPAIAEETLFRGFLLGSLNQSWSKKNSILVTSLIFAAAHLSLSLLPFYFILGIFLGWCQWYGKNLLLPIMAHAVNNLLGLIILGMVQ